MDRNLSDACFKGNYVCFSFSSLSWDNLWKRGVECGWGWNGHLLSPSCRCFSCFISSLSHTTLWGKSYYPNLQMRNLKLNKAKSFAYSCCGRTWIWSHCPNTSICSMLPAFHGDRGCGIICQTQFTDIFLKLSPKNLKPFIWPHVSLLEGLRAPRTQHIRNLSPASPYSAIPNRS